MSIRAHINKAGTLIAFAPVIVMGILFFGALNGAREILLWHNLATDNFKTL